MNLRNKHLLTIVALASLISVSSIKAEPPQTPAQLAAIDEKQDARRFTIVERTKKDILALEEKRKTLAETYESSLKKLQTEREELSATHGKKQVDLAGKLSTLDDKFQAQLKGLRDRRTAVFTNNTTKVAALDKELAAIQEKARVEYTEAISKELKAHDEKRKAQEADRVSSLAIIEDDRVAALNGYFEALASHEILAQAETKKMNDAKSAQLADHAGRAEVAAQAYNSGVTALAAERAKATQKAADDLYALMSVPNRTVPPAALAQTNGPKSLVVDGQNIEMTFTYNGAVLDSKDATAVALKAALTEVNNGKYQKDFSFSEKGEILYKGKVLAVAYHYSVSGIRMALPASTESKLEQGMLSALIQNLYRVPTESFADVLYQPVDESGKPLSLANNVKIPKIVRALLTNDKEDYLGVTQIDDLTIAIDGKKVRLTWYFKDGEGIAQPLLAKGRAAVDEVDARWARQLKRALNPVAVPKEVRARLAPANATAPAALPVRLAQAIKAPERCNNFVFIQNGDGELLVARRKDSKILFRAKGVTSLAGVACATDSVAVIATAIVRTEAVKFDVNQTPGVDIKAADLVATEFEVESKGKVPTLFVIHSDILKIAIVASEGKFAKVQTVSPDKKEGSFRTWAMDDKKAYLTDFTIAVPFDASTAAPDVSAQPGSGAELNLQETK